VDGNIGLIRSNTQDRNDRLVQSDTMVRYVKWKWNNIIDGCVGLEKSNIENRNVRLEWNNIVDGN